MVVSATSRNPPCRYALVSLLKGSSSFDYSGVFPGRGIRTSVRHPPRELLKGLDNGPHHRETASLPSHAIQPLGSLRMWPRWGKLVFFSFLLIHAFLGHVGQWSSRLGFLDFLAL